MIYKTFVMLLPLMFHGQEMTLSFYTHNISLTQDVVCMNQLSGHKLQNFLKNSMFSLLFPLKILCNHAIMLRTSKFEINVKRKNFSSKAIGIINFENLTCSKFYRRHYKLIFKFSVRLKTLLLEGLSEQEFMLT